MLAALYFYAALTPQGHYRKGYAYAQHRFALYTTFQALGWDVLRIRRSCLPQLYYKVFSKDDDLQVLSLYMQQLTQAGVPMLQALECASGGCRNLFQTIVAGVAHGVNAGLSCSTSFATYPFVFDGIICAFIKTGERSGNLSYAFKAAHTYIKQRQQWTGQAKQALRYPLLVGLFSLFSLGFLLLNVLPSLLDFFHSNNQELPSSIKFLYAVWEYKSCIACTVGGIIFLWFLFYHTVISFRLFCHKLWLHIPLFGKLSEALFLERCLLALALLLEQGVNLCESLQTSQNLSSNLCLHASMQRVLKHIEMGESFSCAWENAFPRQRSVFHAARLGEQAGTLSLFMHELSTLYRTQSQETMGKLLGILQPGLLILMGVFMAWVTACLLLPLYESVSPGGLKP